MDEFQLRLIASRIQRLSDEHWSLLEQAKRVMDEDAWVGPSARTFDHELADHNKALQTQLRRACELVHRKAAGPLKGVG